MANSERSKQKAYYEQTAAEYDQMHNAATGEHALAQQYIISLCRQYNLHTLLDVGCGTGIAVKNFNQAGITATGIEPVQELLTVGMTNHGLTRNILLHGFAEKLPYADQSVDVVCEFAVLHHIKNPKPAVAEMLRVAKHAVFISDENRFGRGHLWWRLTKLLWWKLGVFPLGFWLMTGGKGYNETEGDGISYSYSVYDSYPQIAQWADVVFFIPLKQAKKSNWYHPLLSTSHILLCALKHPEASSQ